MRPRRPCRPDARRFHLDGRRATHGRPDPGRAVDRNRGGHRRQHQAAAELDYWLTLQDLRAWEAKHSAVVSGLENVATWESCRRPAPGVIALPMKTAGGGRSHADRGAGAEGARRLKAGIVQDQACSPSLGELLEILPRSRRVYARSPGVPANVESAGTGRGSP
jgi:hypothetical protein